MHRAHICFVSDWTWQPLGKRLVSSCNGLPEVKLFRSTIDHSGSDLATTISLSGVQHRSSPLCSVISVFLSARFQRISVPERIEIGEIVCILDI